MISGFQKMLSLRISKVTMILVIYWYVTYCSRNSAACMKQQTWIISVSVDWELEGLSLVFRTHVHSRGCHQGVRQTPGISRVLGVRWLPIHSCGPLHRAFFWVPLREGGRERKERERVRACPGEKPQLFCHWISEMTPHHSACSTHRRQLSMFSPHATGGPYTGAGEQGSSAASETTDHTRKSGSTDRMTP